MCRMSVKRTIASAWAASPVRVLRVPLACRRSPAEVLSALGDGPLPFALVGTHWAGGGAIVGSDPIRVARDADDPFAILDERPRLADDDEPAPTAPSAEDGSAGSATGWPRAWSASRCRPTGRSRFRTSTSPTTTTCSVSTTIAAGGFEALAADARRDALDERLRWLRGLLHRAPSPPHGQTAASSPGAAAAERAGRDPPSGGGPGVPGASPPARSSRPTSACGSSPAGTARQRRCSAPAWSIAARMPPLSAPPGRDRQPLARAVPAPPRPARRHRADQGHDRARPGSGHRRGRAGALRRSPRTPPST